jgi:hypothetical protein
MPPFYTKGRLPSRWYRGDVPPMPKKKCCSDQPACKRCPLRMMRDGTLPDGYTVKKRKLVKVDTAGTKDKKKSKKSKKSKTKARAKIAA